MTTTNLAVPAPRPARETPRGTLAIFRHSSTTGAPHIPVLLRREDPGTSSDIRSLVWMAVLRSRLP